MRSSIGWVVVVVGVLGCSGREPVCEPGDAVACVCPDGSDGAAFCRAHTLGFGECLCDGPDDAGTDDAALELDAGPTDAGRRDAGRADAGRDAGPPTLDAGPPPACDLYAYDRPCTECTTTPGMGRTCRRTYVDGGPDNLATGPAACQPAGTMLEHAPTLCNENDSRRLCGCGLFCNTGGRCVRYCDPDGEPCPDHMGQPQRCRADAPGGVPFCTFD